MMKGFKHKHVQTVDTRAWYSTMNIPPARAIAVHSQEIEECGFIFHHIPIKAGIMEKTIENHPQLCGFLKWDVDGCSLMDGEWDGDSGNGFTWFYMVFTTFRTNVLVQQSADAGNPIPSPDVQSIHVLMIVA